VLCQAAKSVRWLGEEALRRYLKLRSPSFVPNREEVVNDIRKTSSGAILDPEDKIMDVLDDNDFVSIVLETDRPNPSMEEAEVRYVPAQVAGGKFTMPEEYLHLDGGETQGGHGITFPPARELPVH
jgi:histidine ammonia-lyase